MAGKRSVIETLVVELTTDTSRFNKGIKSMQSTLERAGTNMVRTGRRISRFMVTALGAIGAASVKVSLDYDKAMKRVEAVTMATGEEMDSLGEKARYLGRTTARSAKQIAEGMETLGLAGFETQEIEDSIEAITSLSVISQQEMGQSAQSAANIMSQFGIEADKLDTSVDALAQTATSSNQTLDELVNGLRFAGPIAKQAGLSLEETAAAMGVLANNGIRAGVSGRALRMGMLKLIAPTTQAEERMRQLGISITDQEGNMLGFTDMLDNVNSGIQGLSESERIASLRIMFGTRALGPMNILLQEQETLLENGASAFEDYTAHIRDSEGRAQEMEEILLEDLPGAMILLKSAAEGFLLALEDVYEQHFIGLLEGLFNLLNAFSDLEKGNSVILDYVFNLSKMQETLSTVFGFIAEHFDRMIEKLFGFENASSRLLARVEDTFEGFFNFLEERFGFVFGEDWTRGAVVDVTLLIAAIGPLLVIFGVMSGVLAKVVGLFGALSTGLGVVIKLFGTLGGLRIVTGLALLYAVFRGIVEDVDIGSFTRKLMELVDAFNNLEAGNSIILELVGNIGTLFDRASEYLSGVIGRVREFISDLAESETVVGKAVDFMVEKFGQLSTFVEETFGIKMHDSITQGAIIDIALLVAAIGPLMSVLSALGAVIAPVIAVITTLSAKFAFLAGKSAILAAVSAIGKINAALSVLGTGPIIGIVIAAIAAVATAVAVFGHDFESTKKVVMEAFEGIKESADTFMKAVRPLFKQLKLLWDNIWKSLTTGLIGEALRKLAQSLISVLGSVVEILIEAGTLLVTTITGAINLFNKFVDSDFGGAIGNGLLYIIVVLTEITDHIGTVFNFIAETIGRINNMIRQDWSTFKEKYTADLKAVGELFVNAFTKISNFVVSVFEEIKKAPDAMVAVVYLGLMELIDLIKQGITNLKENLSRFKDDVNSIFDLIFFLIMRGARRAWEYVIGKFEEGWDIIKAIGNGFKDGFMAVAEFFNGGLQLMWETAKGIFETFEDLFDPVFEALEAAVTAKLAAIKTTFSEIFGEDGFIAGLFKDLFGEDGLIRGLFSDIFGKDGFIAGFKDTFTDFFSGIGSALVSSLTGQINSIINAVNTYILDNFNKALEFFGRDEIPRIPEIGGDYEDDRYDPREQGIGGAAYAAKGAYVKKQPGGSPYIVGEGGEDEVISPVSKLQELLNNAIDRTRKQMSGINHAQAMSEQAFNSLGTSLTPINAQQKQNGSQRNISITNNNNFEVSGDVEREIAKALRKHETDQKLRFQGMKT